MSKAIKNQDHILKKLSIEKLKPMQEEALLAIQTSNDVVLLSPTGTGKTLAFLLPIINELDPKSSDVQVMILVPSRELAIQIEQVARDMGTGFKINAVYGGRAGSQDKIDLKRPPAILIGTPGRVADHLRKESFSSKNVKILVLDEFDKSLEVGFEKDMKEILSFLPKINKRILTSATQKVVIPSFVGLNNPIQINYLHEKIVQLKVKTIVSPSRDKLETLVKSIQHIGNQPGIIFCNFKETIQQVSDFLAEENIPHGCFYGGMEQRDRERVLIKFRNGTNQLIVATDLAARGLDIPELKFIIHFELPQNLKEFTHRNGRTARMNNDGTAYVLKWQDERLPDFIFPNSNDEEEEELSQTSDLQASKWKTVYVTGGRRDKISKGDIAGLFFKQGKLKKDELGIIELKQDCAFVGVHAQKLKSVVQSVNNTKLKTKKVRVSEI